MKNSEDKKTAVPELRFPEFVNSGNWEQKTLGKFAHYENGKAHEQDISESGDYISVNAKYISTDGKSKKFTNTPYCIAENNDILMVLSDLPNGRALAKCFFVDKDDYYTVNQRICKLTPTKALGKMLFYVLNRNSHLLSFDDGVKQTNLKKEDVLNCPILLPSTKENFNEQQKIADCLSSIDELIEAEVSTLDLYKEHKKGLLQKLFPQNGKTTPEYRFPEFTNNGEWVETTLGNVFIIFQGYAFSSSDSVEEGARWIKIADVGVQNMSHSTLSYLPVCYKVDYENFVVKQGDYVIALTRPISRGQLKIAPVDDFFHGALLNQRVGKLVSSNNITFVYYLLQTYKIIYDIESSIAGSEPPNLSTKQIEKIKTRIPKSGEQKKIADCLTSIDELINRQADRVETLNAHKKGLMQQLFPKIQ